MDSQLYIRVRGRVLGPYDQEKLQSLARRGQLSRMHELSSDGASWVRASNYPELFVGNPVEMPSDHQPAMVQTTPAAATAASPISQPQAPGQSQWHYTSAGVQRGPVDFGNLQLLCGTGQLGADDLVWAEGMPAWIPASHVPGLIKGATASAGTAEREDTLPSNLCRSAYSSRPWLVFIALAACACAALCVALGIWLLVLGAREQVTITVAIGILYLVWALDWAVGAYLLNAAVSRMLSLQYSPKAIVLEKVHDSLRALWIYVAINFIIHLVLIALVVIMLFSLRVTWPPHISIQ